MLSIILGRINSCEGGWNVGECRINGVLIAVGKQGCKMKAFNGNGGLVRAPLPISKCIGICTINCNNACVSFRKCSCR